MHEMDISPIRKILEPLIKNIAHECIQVHDIIEVYDELYIIRYVTIYGTRTFYSEGKGLTTTFSDRVHKTISDFIKSNKRDKTIEEVLNGNYGN